MQRNLFLATAAVAALSLAACHKNAESGANTTEAGNVAETGNAAVAGNVAEAGNSAMTAANPAAVAPHDTGAFVDNLVQSNDYEIEAAKVAEQKSASPDVKAFARLMVKDHTALGREAKPVIDKSGHTPPAGLDPRRQGLLDNLKAAGPQDFDKMYVDQQVTAHQETLALLNGYAQNGDNADLKRLATKATPIVQEHLDKAQALQSKLATGGAAGNTAG